MRLLGSAMLLLVTLAAPYPSAYADALLGLGNCDFNQPSGINFGTYDPFSGASINSNANSIDVSCTAILGTYTYTIALSTGASNSYAARTMTAAGTTSPLNYNIYTTNAHTTVWGNGSSGTVMQGASVLVLLFAHTASYTLYGHVPGSQTAVQVPPGQSSASYSDTIIVTYTYN